MPETFEIKIGNWSEKYVYITTNAPKRYDHGGAINLYDGDERHVLIPESALEWQKGRNGSGLYRTDEQKLDSHGRNCLTEKLFKLLMGASVMHGTLGLIDDFFKGGGCLSVLHPGAMLGDNQRTIQEQIDLAHKMTHHSNI